MVIRFKNVIPIPIKNEFSSNGELWGKVIEFTSSEYSLIDAHSGKGKSTFTSLLAGLRFDYEGEIFVGDKNIRLISKSEWSDLRRNKLSFIFQDLQLFEKLTVGENLLIKSKLTDFKSEEEIVELLKQVGLDHKWNQLCGNLSLGQQQRIAIIRALLQPADFLIMDEPFSHLDDLNTQIAMNLIQNHCLENKTGIILTTLGQQYTIQWHKKIRIA
jgi:putative ABC transport system ATP-binding protein